MGGKKDKVEDKTDSDERGDTGSKVREGHMVEMGGREGRPKGRKELEGNKEEGNKRRRKRKRLIGREAEARGIREGRGEEREGKEEMEEKCEGERGLKITFWNVAGVGNKENFGKH